MEASAVRRATTADRETLADWLASLDDPLLSTPSYCGAWTVKAVAAHLVVAMSAGVPALLREAVRHRGNLHAANAGMANAWARRPMPELVATMRSNAGRRLTNPGTGPLGPLTDVLVHSGDMRLPLGRPFEPPVEHVVAALGFLTGRRPVGFVPRGRLDGLRLVADDVGFRSGTGAELLGRGADLMMAAAGRAQVLPNLQGAGVAVLRERLAKEA